MLPSPSQNMETDLPVRPDKLPQVLREGITERNVIAQEVS